MITYNLIAASEASNSNRREASNSNRRRTREDTSQPPSPSLSAVPSPSSTLPSPLLQQGGSASISREGKSLAIAILRYTSMLLKFYHLEFRAVHAKQLEQNKRLYLMLCNIQDDLLVIKNDIKKQKKERESDLSARVLDVSGLFLVKASSIDYHRYFAEYALILCRASTMASSNASFQNIHIQHKKC